MWVTQLFTVTSIEGELAVGRVPHCQNCTHLLNLLKPDVVFFGDARDEAESAIREDLQSADLLLVVGSTLEAEPLRSIPKALNPNVPQLLISPTQTSTKNHDAHDWDVELIGDVNVWGCDRMRAQMNAWRAPSAAC